MNHLTGRKEEKDCPSLKYHRKQTYWLTVRAGECFLVKPQVILLPQHQNNTAKIVSFVTLRWLFFVGTHVWKFLRIGSKTPNFVHANKSFT